jgi:succinoglycan biosynthesis protein ExoO
MATLSEVCHEPLLDTLVIDMAGLLRRLGFERDGMAVGLTKPLIRRQFLIDHGIEYDTTLHVVEDYWMLADCVAAGAKFVIIPEAHYYYRLHPQQSTTVAGSPRDITSTKARLQAFLDSPLAFVEPEAANFARYHIQRMEVLASYAVFSDALKRRHVGRALGEAVRHPRVVGEFAARLPYAIERRRRSRLGDPFAFDPLSSGHRTRPMPTRLSR